MVMNGGLYIYGGQGMCTHSFADTFNRANSASLGAEWYEDPTYPHLTINSNACRLTYVSSDPEYGRACPHVQMCTPNHALQLESWTGWDNVTGDATEEAHFYLWGRMASLNDASNCYYAYVRDSEVAGNKQRRIYKRVSDVATSLANDADVDDGTWTLTIDTNAVHDQDLQYDGSATHITADDTDISAGGFVCFQLVIQSSGTLSGGYTQVTGFTADTV